MADHHIEGATFHPTSRLPTRIVTLDVIRGVAVIGILLMNIISFSMPTAAYINPNAWPAMGGGTDFADRAAYALSYIFVDGKMRALFSLLFGASMVLVLDRADARDENGGKVHFARMMSLLLIGLFHTYFIWQGDILVLYALCGMVTFLFLDKSPATLIKIGIACITLGFIMWLSMGIAMIGLEHIPTDQLDKADAAELDMMRRMIGTDFAVQMKEVTAMRGDYATVFTYRAANLASPLGQFAVAGAETVGLMAMGAGLMRQGFFSGAESSEWSRQRLKRLALALAPLSIIALTAQVLWLWHNSFPDMYTFAAATGFSLPFDYLLAVAYAALLVLWASAGKGNILTKRLAATGRAAFTNYLGTSIVMTIIFYGYGLGLFGKIGRAEVYLFVVAAAFVMLAWSQPWLKHFQYGPMEWLWRSMARLELQLMRKSDGS